MMVFVISSDKEPVDPCHPARARKLLSTGKAAVFRRYPFTIILKDREASECSTKSHRLKLDPGAKTTGLAVLQGERVVWAAQLSHRGFQIRDGLTSRRQLRRGRRSRKTRYRKPRFLNRTRKAKWLPPSLESRIADILTWVERIRKFCPIGNLSQELVRFDTQQMQNPEISGTEYQQGELAGYEVREYLLEKYHRTCQYCSAKDVPLEVEHIVPKSRGGSNRVSNLTLSCRKCNQKKGNKPIEQFLLKKPDLLKKILSRAKAPLKDAAAVNATRWKLYERLQGTGLPIETGTGARTKFNRTRANLPKTHWLDAACVGASTPERLVTEGVRVLSISAKGHGKRQRCGTDKYGFPVRHAPTEKFFRDFQTGDIVKAVVPSGKYKGEYTGRIAIRFRPSFKLSSSEKSFDVHPKYLTVVHKADGYEYSFARSG